MKIAAIAAFGAALIFASPALGDEYNDSIEALCQRIKTCALAQMGEEAKDMSEQMKQMIAAQMETMCVGIKQQYTALARFHVLYRPAIACMRSMADLSCPELQSGKDDVTPECASFREQAREYE